MYVQDNKWSIFVKNYLHVILQRYIVNRFPVDLDGEERADWILNGRVISYGKDEKAEISLSVHNDRDNGIWNQVQSVYFSPNENVKFNVYAFFFIIVTKSLVVIDNRSYWRKSKFAVHQGLPAKNYYEKFTTWTKSHQVLSCTLIMIYILVVILCFETLLYTSRYICEMSIWQILMTNTFMLSTVKSDLKLYHYSSCSFLRVKSSLIVIHATRAKKIKVCFLNYILSKYIS